MKRLVVRPKVCSGCRACVVACVAHHEGRYGTAAARLYVSKIEPLGVDRPGVCLQCEPAPCVLACPAAALERDGTSGALRLHPDLCSRCGECALACPQGVINLHRETGLPLVCDLCRGEPACVRRCATGALRYATVGDNP